MTRLLYAAAPGELTDFDFEQWEDEMYACCVCGAQGTSSDVTAESEQRGADGFGWDALYQCRDRRACASRVMALMAEDMKAARPVPPGSTTAHAA